MASTSKSPANANLSVCHAAADETMFDVSTIQSSLRKVTAEINESLEATATGAASTSDEPNDPFHGRKFDQKGSAIAANMQKLLS